MMNFIRSTVSCCASCINNFVLLRIMVSIVLSTLLSYQLGNKEIILHNESLIAISRSLISIWTQLLKHVLGNSYLLIKLQL